MAQIDGAGQQDTDDQNAEALQAALAQRQVTLPGPPQGGSDVPIHQNSDPVSTNRKFYAPGSLLPENVVYRASSPKIFAQRLELFAFSGLAAGSAAGGDRCGSPCSRSGAEPRERFQARWPRFAVETAAQHETSRVHAKG